MSLYKLSRRGFLGSTLLGATALALPSRLYGSNEGLVSGAVKDMFSGDPYEGALVTLVNDNGESYQTRASSNVTAVESTSWADVKRMMRASASLKPASVGSGVYSILVPNGVYTLAITDGNVGSAKPTTNDLFNRQLQEGERFAPRIFRLRVNGDTVCDESVAPKDFDFEYAWTVMGDKICRADYGDMNFYIDESPARDDWIPTSNG